MEINLDRIVKLLKKNVVLIVAVAMIFTIAASLYSVFFIKPQYSTGSRFKISLTTDLKERVDTITYTARLLSLVNEVTGSFDSDSFYKMVSERVADSGLDIEPGDIAKKLSVKLESDDTTYFTIRVVSGSASQAKLISDAVSECALEYVGNLDNNYTLVLMKQGQLPKSPSSPNILKNALTGLVFGIAACIAYVILADMLDRRVKGTADLVERFGYPILGIVPHFTLDESKESADGKDVVSK